MTALKQYDRLESEGIWRPAPDAQRRDVTVFFGDATVVIADGAGRPLAHWSLPAIVRANPGVTPALFQPAEDATETLEIADPLMIDAIETVLRSVARRRPAPGRLRHLVTGGIMAALLAASVFWLPGALREQTLRVVPQSKRAEIGASILGHLQSLTGPACRGAQGRQALSQLQARLMGAGAAGQIVVLPLQTDNALALPGDITVLDQSVLRLSDDPAVPAGFVLTADAARQKTDPLAPLLRFAGLRGTLELLTTGEMPSATLRDYAASMLAAPPDPDTADLVARFRAAEVPTAPYAQALVTLGRSNPDLALADPMQGNPVPVILPDGAWVSLQGICDV